MNRNSKGFTLIELMIVVAIIGLLVAIALPSYNDYIRKARRTDAMDALLDCASFQARNYTAASPPTYLTQEDFDDDSLCNDGVSKEGYYNITVANASCTQDDTVWCFALTATPVSPGAQASDTDCVIMTVDHRSNKTAANSDGDVTTGVCWRT